MLLFYFVLMNKTFHMTLKNSHENVNKSLKTQRKYFYKNYRDSLVNSKQMKPQEI